MYIKTYLTHVDTGIGATDFASYSGQRFKYREPNFPGITIVHRMDVDGPIPYFLCTATDNYDMDTEHSSTGITSMSQSEWDNIINTYDSKQETERYGRVRQMRDDALDESDMYVIKQVECNVAITTEFRTWRQQLRDLPNGEDFPINWPTPPSNVVGIITNGEYQSTLKSIPMINDPIV